MTLAERVTAPAVRPVFLGFLDFGDEPVWGWTGPGAFAPAGTGDPDLDGNVFLPVEGAVEISGFGENLGGGRPVSLVFSAETDDAPVIRQIVRDRRYWRLRRAKIWLGFLVEDFSEVHNEIVPLFSGVMVGAETSRKPGQPATIALTLDRDLRAAYGAEVRWLDHGRFNSSDRFSSFIIDLAKGPLASTPVASAGAGAGGSSGRPRGGGGGFGGVNSLPGELNHH